VRDAKENCDKKIAAQNPPGFRAAIFFRAVFLRAAHNGLSERWATSSLFYFGTGNECSVDNVAIFYNKE